jgi:hypothetical protein
MIGEFVAMAAFAVLCALFGVIVALALNKWAVGRTVTIRTFLASAASLFPALGIVAIAAGGSPELLLAMSPDEFLIPFALQLAAIIALAAPSAWLVSRRKRGAPSQSKVFE